MKYLLILLLLIIPGTSLAVCPGHQQSIIATPEGTFRMCPQDTSGGPSPQPVVLGFYKQCSVTGVWQGGSAVVTIVNPVPGVPVIVGFLAARGAGGATATCTNADGVESSLSASSVLFRPVELSPAQPPVLGVK